jgi:hypothetical protein
MVRDRSRKWTLTRAQVRAGTAGQANRIRKSEGCAWNSVPKTERWRNTTTTITQGDAYEKEAVVGSSGSGRGEDQTVQLPELESCWFLRVPDTPPQPSASARRQTNRRPHPRPISPVKHPASIHPTHYSHLEPLPCPILMPTSATSTHCLTNCHL